MYLVWAVFGGFLLHILLCNLLTVLLKPRYEEPVNSAYDLIERNITPFTRKWRGTAEFDLRVYFSTFPDPVYKEIANRLKVPNDEDNEKKLWDRINSEDPNYRTALLKTKDGGPEYWHEYYFSEEIVKMESLYFEVHIINKKWPLKKV